MFRYFNGLTGIMGVGLLVLTSCAPTEDPAYSYDKDFQVVSVTAPTLQASNDKLTHSNEDLTITYNFWEEGGKMAYVIQNKSDRIIYLDLKRTFFIKNGTANDYYIDKKKTATEVSGQSNKEFYSSFGTEENVAYSASSSQSIEIANKAKLAIPPASHKSLSRFNLTTSVFDYCGLDQAFSDFEEGSYTKSFNRQSSPLIFENYLKYSFDKDLEEVKTIRDAFYVSKIRNVERKDFYKQIEVPERCDSTETKEITVKPYSAEFRFYNTYEVW